MVGVEEQDEERHGHAGPEQDPLHGRTHHLEDGAGRLPGDGHVLLARHPVALGEKGQHRGDQQDNGQGSPTRQIIHPRHLEIDLDRQDREPAPAQDEGISEVRNGLDEKNQEGAGDSGKAEGQRHPPEGLPAGGPQVRRRILQRAAQRLQDAPQGEVGDREEGEDLGQQEAAHPVDGELLEAEELTGDQAVVAEEQDDGEGTDERGRDHREDRRHREERLAGYVGPGQGKGEQEPDQAAAQRREDPHHDAVQERLLDEPASEELPVEPDGRDPVRDEADREHPGEGIGDEEQQQREDDGHPHSQKRLVPEQAQIISRSAAPPCEGLRAHGGSYLAVRRTSLIQRSTSRFFSFPAQIAS
jgi:hypothetical protein